MWAVQSLNKTTESFRGLELQDIAGTLTSCLPPRGNIMQADQNLDQLIRVWEISSDIIDLQCILQSKWIKRPLWVILIRVAGPLYK